MEIQTLDLLDISDELTNDEKQKIIEHLFKQFSQNKVEQMKKKEKEKENDIDLMKSASSLHTIFTK